MPDFQKYCTLSYSCTVILCYQFILLTFIFIPPFILYIFYKVIFCFPRGSQKNGNANWLGYAYLNGWNGYYNDEWCSSLSTLAHEIGHNLNLGHSGVPGGSEYGDEIGMVSKQDFCRSGGGVHVDISVFMLRMSSIHPSHVFLSFVLAG